MRDAPAVLAAGVMGRAFWAIQVSRGCARSMLLCVVKVLRGRWQTSDGPLGVEGGLLLGQAFPVMVLERRAGRSIEGQPVGVRQLSGQARRSRSQRGRCR